MGLGSNMSEKERDRDRDREGGRKEDRRDTSSEVISW